MLIFLTFLVKTCWRIYFKILLLPSAKVQNIFLSTKHFINYFYNIIFCFILRFIYVNVDLYCQQKKNDCRAFIVVIYVILIIIIYKKSGAIANTTLKNKLNN